ncbi:DUF4435 domain-containing protein [Pseudomonas extremaustralis]|uniref:DUF4435 domain-containing protein n=1 Tax=Pseudomonas extremaustralis TaxID=359110 RepID=UPI002307131D|nr:DUF4435 domain-containing protein [Pseudomonas extremaustralis]MDB1113970.1 DUF4435 domain-containing protein [Pseudomonas extremaustralis]
MLSDSEYGFIVSSIDIQKASYFNIDGSDRSTVMVWVESREDKRFWGAYLPAIDGVHFDVKIASQATASDGKKANGCTRLLALKAIGDLIPGPNLIFCLDSDERFLSGIYRSGCVTVEAHIYYTNVYSIENAILHGAHADRVFEAVAACSIRDLAYGPSQFLAKVSAAVHSTVLLLAFSLENFDYDIVGVFKRDFLASIAQVGSMDLDTAIDDSDIFYEFKVALSEINTGLLLVIYDRGFEQLYSKFLGAILGELVDESNAYLFVRGHDLFNSFVRVFEAGSKKKKNAEISLVAQLHGGAKDMIKAVRNEWVEFEGALKYGFYAATPAVPFFDRTIDRIKADYGPQ